MLADRKVSPNPSPWQGEFSIAHSANSSSLTTTIKCRQALLRENEPESKITAPRPKFLAFRILRRKTRAGNSGSFRRNACFCRRLVVARASGPCPSVPALNRRPACSQPSGSTSLFTRQLYPASCRPSSKIYRLTISGDNLLFVAVGRVPTRSGVSGVRPLREIHTHLHLRGRSDSHG